MKKWITIIFASAIALALSMPAVAQTTAGLKSRFASPQDTPTKDGQQKKKKKKKKKNTEPTKSGTGKDSKKKDTQPPQK